MQGVTLNGKAVTKITTPTKFSNSGVTNVPLRRLELGANARKDVEKENISTAKKKQKAKYTYWSIDRNGD